MAYSLTTPGRHRAQAKTSRPLLGTLRLARDEQIALAVLVLLPFVLLFGDALPHDHLLVPGYVGGAVGGGLYRLLRPSAGVHAGKPAPKPEEPPSGGAAPESDVEITRVDAINDFWGKEVDDPTWPSQLPSERDIRQAMSVKSSPAPRVPFEVPLEIVYARDTVVIDPGPRGGSRVSRTSFRHAAALSMGTVLFFDPSVALAGAPT